MICTTRYADDGRRGVVDMGNMRGFTLIELMVTVAIVAILVSIAVPAYQDSVRKGRRGQVKADLVEYAQVAERYHTVNNTYVDWEPPHAVSPSTGGAHYSVVESGLTATTFTLTATPTSGSQLNDRCGVLTLDQAGRKTHAVGTDAECGFGTLP